jgi:hypothetical protein
MAVNKMGKGKQGLMYNDLAVYRKFRSRGKGDGERREEEGCILG